MTVSLADFAKLHGVSKKTVAIWRQQGQIVMDGPLVDAGQSDPLLRDARLGRYRDWNGEDEPGDGDMESAFRGGVRPGAGRPKGSPNVGPATFLPADPNITPLELLMQVVRSPEAPLKLRLWAAKEAAPYTHAKLSPQEADGKKTKRQDRAAAASSSGKFAVRDSPKSSVLN